VLRILKIITPVKCVIPLYDGNIVPPEEGKLHRRFNRVQKPLAWSADIDELKGGMYRRGLQLLWDT
jgi:hypothetical protein